MNSPPTKAKDDSTLLLALHQLDPTACGCTPDACPCRDELVHEGE